MSIVVQGLEQSVFSSSSQGSGSGVGVGEQVRRLLADYGCGSADRVMWFRDDLRLRDNAAFEWLCGGGVGGKPVSVVAVFVLETQQGSRPLGRASQWWLYHSLCSLTRDLAQVGVPLVVCAGDSSVLVPELVRQLGARKVAWSRRYHAPLCAVDASVKETLKQCGVDARSFAGFLLTEPWQVSTNQGGDYRVYGPFSKKAMQVLAQERIDAPTSLSHTVTADLGVVRSSVGGREHATMAAVDGLCLLPAQRGEPAWDKEFAQHHRPGETGAWARAEEFFRTIGTRHSDDGYARGRDFPSKQVVSGLSPHFRFGEISPRVVYDQVIGVGGQDALVFCKELLWRDFAWHRLFHNPMMAVECIRGEFEQYPWARFPLELDAIYRSQPAGSRDEFRLVSKQVSTPESDFVAWARGTTGISLVDAGMRELWRTGVMHNRVRMVTGSLLTKNLGIDWRLGEQWFWDALVDADLAANPFNWQWVAGCGDDAAPFFRIFNPDTQAKRFDPDATYRKEFIEEFSTPSYPPPLVDLKESRRCALDAYRSL
ncbi:MAG: deoxyribodipyrimidine photo-lyase [Corynebacterium sp.]|uniref:cryptochrome/photolyase family protein n=1 Tax=Corynebacterium sp. TaxID=1720 RepID=UPI0026DBCB7F|nr:deoxyribodipyrimidine photo-lyase [Corynebacterium sp.]MDO4760300.1 deoxyribodipyrimidine photo-lyase [Corynebacterium sp.]